MDAPAGGRVWAISDLHLAPRYGAPAPADTNPCWLEHPKELIAAWREHVGEDDVVLLPGDIAESTGAALQAAVELLDRLPGRKIIAPGNHDPEVLFAGSEPLGKRRTVLALSGHRVERISWREGRTALVIGAVGSWETEDPDEACDVEAGARLFGQLNLALVHANAMRACAGDSREPIVLLHHHPPFMPRFKPGGVPALQPTRSSDLIESAGVWLCLTGHLHYPEQWRAAFQGQRGNTRYLLVSGDYLGWMPADITSMLDSAWT